jgi:hypothetical protein
MRGAALVLLLLTILLCSAQKSELVEHIEPCA